MRIWSLHPQYLDVKGLVALWRETLLAKNVLAGNTKGYRNHPQLKRFKDTKNPPHTINQYLSVIYEEAVSRGYTFTREKIDWDFIPTTLMVTRGQMEYEKNHLLSKLKTRDFKKFQVLKEEKMPKVHPLFETIEGEIEEWEIR